MKTNNEKETNMMGIISLRLVSLLDELAFLKMDPLNGQVGLRRVSLRRLSLRRVGLRHVVL